MKLIAATNNPHKLEEMRRILAPLGIETLSMAEIGAASEADETGETFAENAYIKARDLFDKTGLPTVADDSGLCVDALDGRPGVRSARYGGENLPHCEKMKLLLAEMSEVSKEKRTARFISAICCILNESCVIECEGVCEGSIGYEPRGNDGFGYDPIFVVGNRSYAELSGAEKDEISHRGKALRLFSEKLRDQLT